MEILKGMLMGKDMHDIEKNLEERITTEIVKKDTLDKLEKLNKRYCGLLYWASHRQSSMERTPKTLVPSTDRTYQEAELLMLKNLQIRVV